MFREVGPPTNPLVVPAWAQMAERRRRGLPSFEEFNSEQHQLEPELWRACLWCKRYFHPRLYRWTPDATPLFNVRTSAWRHCSQQCDHDQTMVRQREYYRRRRANN